MEHLSLEIFDLPTKEDPHPIGSKYASLDADASITIVDTSELFASGDVWSHSFTLNVNANEHIFGTAGDMHGSRLHEQVNKRRARLWVEGMPLYTGYLRLDNEADVDEEGNLEVNFEGGQKTFDEMIEGAKANQVPMMGDVRIGMALWRKRWMCSEVKLMASAEFGGSSSFLNTGAAVVTHRVNPSVPGDEDPQLTYFVCDGEDDDNSVPLYPRMVFPKGKFNNLKTGVVDEEVNCLNTDYPYDDNHPYCNVALCYQQSGYTRTKEENGITTTYEDYGSEPEAQRGYEVMPANRVNSAPNFFVIYWIKALMKHLNIYIEENQMMDVEDLRRLFFVNTKCAYKEPKKLRDSEAYDPVMGQYQFGSKGNPIAEYFGELKDETYGRTMKRYDGLKRLAKIENCSMHCTGFTPGKWTDGRGTDYTSQMPNIEKLVIKVSAIAGMSQELKGYAYDDLNSYLHNAIATSECFPDVDISQVINAIESGFGVRFLFSDDYQRVRIILLRNVFRSEEVQNIKCEIISEAKSENSIRGFRMTYGGDTDDTHFYYKGFADKLPHKKPYFIDDSDKHDYSHWDLNASYAGLLNKISSFDKTCYVDPSTGNAYGIKIDKDAKRYYDLHPSLFEYAGFMDAEDGDCTGEEDTIETVNVGFKPAIMNDVNYLEERNGTNNAQRFALFVEESMRPRRPDLEDLPDNQRQPGVKSYDDSDAVYDVDKLYAKHGPQAPDGKMVSDGIVKPGEFAITSDIEARQSGLNATVYSNVISPGQGLVRVKCDITGISISGHINDGYRLYLQDNYEPNDDGVSPIETHDWGLTLGIMRGSGGDAYVNYSADPDDGEDNDTWDIVAGSNVSAHPDTCDSYGNLWDYNGNQPGTGSEVITVSTPQEAKDLMVQLWPNSNFDLTNRTSSNYLKNFMCITVYDADSVRRTVTVALIFSNFPSPNQAVEYTGNYTKSLFTGKSVAQMFSIDASHDNLLIEVDGSQERARTLIDLQYLAFGGGPSVSVDAECGVNVLLSRFSLKLRAEKLNPYFDGKQEESASNQRYLEISNKNLRNRGLIDQFYKEYSYWVRNARTANIEGRMELAQYLSIDKTKKVKVGDITGYIKKRQLTVSNKTGVGNVAMEILYI